jgi:hypothetical protein
MGQQVVATLRVTARVIACEVVTTPLITKTPFGTTSTNPLSRLLLAPVDLPTGVGLRPEANVDKLLDERIDRLPVASDVSHRLDGQRPVVLGPVAKDEGLDVQQLGQQGHIELHELVVVLV